jgi:putative endonuclease
MPQTPITEPTLWYLYLLECESGAYYTGIATDVLRRFNEHLAGVGARYTRANPPVRLIGICEFANRSEATIAEAAVKKLSRDEKRAYFID